MLRRFIAVTFSICGCAALACWFPFVTFYASDSAFHQKGVKDGMGNIYLQVTQPVLTFGENDRCLFDTETLCGILPTNTVSDVDTDEFSFFGMVGQEDLNRIRAVELR